MVKEWASYKELSVHDQNSQRKFGSRSDKPHAQLHRPHPDMLQTHVGPLAEQQTLSVKSAPQCLAMLQEPHGTPQHTHTCPRNPLPPDPCHSEVCSAKQGTAAESSSLSSPLVSLLSPSTVAGDPKCTDQEPKTKVGNCAHRGPK